jgi:hypothetical protein
MSKPHNAFVDRHCAKLRHELSAARKSVPVDWFQSILVVGELGSHPKTRHLDALSSGQPGRHAGGSDMARVRRTVTMQVPRHITLARVESDTAGKFYETALDPQNVVFCTCEAWRYLGRTCKHLKAFRAKLTEAA